MKKVFVYSDGTHSIAENGNITITAPGVTVEEAYDITELPDKSQKEIMRGNLHSLENEVPLVDKTVNQD